MLITTVRGILVWMGILSLAWLILPNIGSRPSSPQAAARRAIKDIEQAMLAYHANYNHLPTSSAVRQRTQRDFTYGTTGVSLPTEVDVRNPRPSPQANNAEVIAILMARAQAAHNENHVHNPQKKLFLNPKFATEDGQPGVGPTDGVYRDPWGMPYIISLDTDDDGFTQDVVYSRNTVSLPSRNKGHTGLQSRSGKDADDFVFKGRVMIWSLGPDRQVDPNLPAEQGVNADNILSWR